MTERQELGSLEAMLFAHAEPVETARLADALRVLHRVGLEPSRIFITAGDGSYREVEL